jgi:ankyrin repeat protein
MGCKMTVQRLIENNQTIINNENLAGETPAMFAALNGQTEMLEMLLDHGAKLWANSHDSSEKEEERKTCLDWAVENRRASTAKAILRRDNWKEVSCVDFKLC